MGILKWYEVDTEVIRMRFVDTVDPDTLINANFTITDLTNSIVHTEPFKPIVVNRDYYSINKTLILYWNFTLTPETDYVIHIHNLKAVFNLALPNEDINFNTTDIAIDPADTLLPPTRDITDVEDYSIKEIPDLITLPADVSLTDDSTLRIIDITPDMDTGYNLAATNAEGRIDVVFNLAVAANYISSDYFKIQRKPLSRSIARWEDVDALVTADRNTIYIYLPSSDTIPVYGVVDKEYWAQNYKYRLRVISGIGAM